VNLKTTIYFMLILSLGFACKNNKAPNISLHLFNFQNASGASKLIIQDTMENFFSKICPLDIALQLRKTSHPENTYLQNLQSDVATFSQTEINKISPILFDVETKLAKLNSLYQLPDYVHLIKSKGALYGPHTFYTRENSIIIPQAEIDNLEDSNFSDIILHEIFHILSRHHPTLKKNLYATIGFTPLNAELKINESFNERILLNPDGINFKYKMSIKSEVERYEVIPIIYSKAISDATTESYFENLIFDLFPIRAEKGIWYLSSPEEAALLDLKSHQSFYAQIGRNTNYIIHPDEILADNFILMINNRSGNGKRGNDILAKMSSILLN